MPGIMGDKDVLGHFEYLKSLLESETWREVWGSLNIHFSSFEKLGLPPEAPDRLVWETCQSHEIILFTGNRNSRGPDSLGVVLRELNQPHHLPVLTLGDPKRFMDDRAYAERVVEAVYDYLSDLENYRGTGRLFVPKPETS